MRRGMVIACVAAAALGMSPAGTALPAAATSGPPPARSTGLPDLAPLAAAALPAVVGVLTSQAPPDREGALDGLEELSRHFRGDAGRQRGIATGFIIDPDGWIATNAHVVEGASRVQVELGEDDERLPARVVGADAASDVALLKVDAGRPLPALPLGDSDRLRVADWVLVVGNPFGLSLTVTAGIVSQVDRSTVSPAGRDGWYDFIQTDAAINPGNSGGPLLDLSGRVVGIATAVNASGQGIGFAVPIDMAKVVLRQLRERGRVVHGWMGVSVRELRGEAARGGARGLLVTGVARGSPAERAGLRAGDVITGLGGRAAPSAARMRWWVATAGVGAELAVGVRRGGGDERVRVRLSEEPAERRDAALQGTASDPQGLP